MELPKDWYIEHDGQRLVLDYKKVEAVFENAVGIVMKNSGGSANPETVEKVVRALLGERVSFVELPRIV